MAETPTLLAGRYVYERELGGGGGGRVVLARDTTAEISVALKLVEAEAYAQLLAEQEALRGLHHPALARVHELLRLEVAVPPPFGLARGAAVLVEDYVEGADPIAHLERFAPTERAREAVRIAMDVGRALVALHGRGLLHGDVKPANIVVAPTGSVLVDLGLAGPPRAADGRLRGTPGFIPPEGLLGERSVATDVFALGATLHRMLGGVAVDVASFDTGSFEAGSAHVLPTPRVDDLPSEVPRGVVELVRAMVASESADRPTSVRDVLARLRRAVPTVDGMEGAEDAPTPLERSLRARSLPWVGDAATLDALVQALDAGGLVRVVGPEGSGRSRLVREAVTRLQRRRAEHLQAVPTYVRGALGTVRSPAHAHVRHLERAPGADELARAIRSAQVGGQSFALVVESSDVESEAESDGARRIAIEPLDASRMSTLLGMLTGAEPTDAFLQTARRASGGLAGRLCRLFADGFAAGRDPTRAEVLQELGKIGTGRVPELARDLAERLTIAGGSLHPRTLGAAASPMGALLAEGLATVSPAGRLELRRDIALSVRQELPARRAAALAQSLEGDDAPSCAYLAAHRADPDAATLFLSAASAAAGQGRLEEAEQLLTDGMTLTGADASPLLSRVRMWAGRYDAALEGSSDPELRAEILRRAGRSEEAGRVLAEAGVTTGATAAWLALGAGNVDVARDAAPEDASGLEVQAWLALTRGDASEAERLVRRALAEQTARPDPRLAARLTTSLGAIQKAAGDLEGSARSQRAALEMADALGERHLAATAAANLGASLLELGDLGPALDELQESARRLMGLGRDRDVGRALFNLASAELVAGDDAMAEVHLEQAEAAAARAGDAGAREHLALLAALIAVRRDDTERARTLGTQLRDAELRSTLAAQLALSAADAAADLLDEDDESVSARLARAGLAIGAGDASAANALLDGLDPELAWADALRAALLRTRLAKSRGDVVGEDTSAARARTLLDRAGRDLSPARRARLRRVPEYQPAADARREVGRAPAAPSRWRRLGALAKRFASEHRVSRLRDEVTRAALELVDAERACVVQRTRLGELRVRASVGEGADSVSRSIVSRVLESGEAVSTVDAASDERLGSTSIHSLALRSVLCVPLRRRTEVLYLDDRVRPAAFDADDRALLQDLADLASIALSNAEHLRAGRREARRLARRQEKLTEELEVRRAELAALRDGSESGIVAVSTSMKKALTLAAKVAAADLPVLIRGESGTGKELVARAIHMGSPRREGPYVSENCGAIPDSLLESALFGHERGAFTGAHAARIGLFEAAHGGTLFLDEVGEMSAPMQAKLLRVVQDGEVRRVGSESARHVDVRLVAATHRDLEKWVAEGRFREDLYYRIAVVTVPLPPLRDRPEDIAPLVSTLLARHAEIPPRVSAEAMTRLQSQPWPGNVRQLENELRRALVLCDDVLDVEHLTAQTRLAASQSTARAGFDLKGQVSDLERELLERALEHTDGNVTQAAKLLGLSRYGLQKMMKRLDVTR